MIPAEISWTDIMDIKEHGKALKPTSDFFMCCANQFHGPQEADPQLS